MPDLGAFRVLRFDGLGQGQSPKPAGIYDLDLQLEQLVNLLNETKWSETHVLGISNGGCVSLALAHRFPKRVLSCVATDCYDRVTPLLRAKLLSWLDAHRLGGAQHRFDVAKPWVWGETFMAEHAEMIQGYRDRASSLEPQAVEALLKGALTHNVAIEQINKPLIFAVGEEDVLTPPFEMLKMADRVGARLEKIPGGHASLIEFPESVGMLANLAVEKVSHVV